MKRRTGFTLIELLVVIAIIALLLAILVPALNYVKQQATGIVCQTNQRGLALSWFLYQEDHNGNLVGTSNYYAGGRPTPYRWIERPLFNDTDNPGAPPEGYGSSVPAIANLTLEYRLNGIRAGKMFPYTENEKLYHCPGDRYWKTMPAPQAAYISYAGAGLMNNEDFISNTRVGWPGRVPSSGWRSINMPSGGTKRLQMVEKFSEIVSPARKYVFVEEDYVSHNQSFYAGGFVLMEDRTTDTWWDWPAAYHKDRSTLAFADGHAEKHTWTDPRTISIMTDEPMPGGGRVALPYQPDNPDLQWMIRGYVAAGWK